MAISGGDGSIILDTKVDTKGLNSGLNSMKGAITKIGGLLASAFSVKLLINFAKESSNLYKIQMQNEVKLATVMRQRMKATDDEIKSVLELASAQQQIGIIGDEVQLAGLQQIATFATQKETIETLLPAMNNLIAQQYGYEASTESARNAANLMGKVLQGQTGALTRVGITFSEAEEQMLKTGNEMERAAVLAKVITNNVGEMNTALAQTDVGRQQQLANTWGDIKEQFGAAFQQIAIIALPVLNTVAKALAWVANVARMVAQTISNMFGMKTSSGGGGNPNVGIGGMATSTEEAAEGMSDLGNATEKAGKQAKKSTTSFDELNTFTENTALSVDEAIEEISNISSGVGTGFNFGVQEAVDITPLESTLTKIVEKIKEAFKPLTKISFKNLGKSLSGLVQPLKKLGLVAWDTLESAIEKVIAPLGEFVIEDVLPRFFNTFGIAVDGFRVILDNAWDILEQFIDEFLNPIWEYTEPKILEVLDNLNTKLNDFIKIVEESEAWEDFQTIMSAIYDVLEPVVKAIVDFLTPIINFQMSQAFIDLEYKFKNFEDEIGAIADLINGDFDEAWKHLKELFVDNFVDKGKEKFKAFSDVIEGITGFDLEQWVKDTWENVKKFWTEKIAPIFTKKWWEDLGKTCMNGLISGFESGINGIVWAFESMINWIVDGLNKIQIQFPEWAGGYSFGVDIQRASLGRVSIPRLAQGAVLPPNKPFLSIVGDQKHGTNIEAPLDTIKEAVAEVLASMNVSNAFNGTIEVPVNIDGREIARAVRQAENTLGTQTVKGAFADAY